MRAVTSHTLKDCIGTKITAEDTQKELGKVKDVVIDNEAKRVLAFVVTDGKTPDKIQVVPLEKATTIAPDGIMVKTESDLGPAQEDPKIAEAAVVTQPLKGLAVITKSGQSKGTVKDVSFDMEGAILNYLLDDGSALPLNPQEEVVGSQLIIPDEVTPQPAPTEEPPKEGPMQKMAQKVTELKENATESISAKKEEEIVGKTVNKAILAPDDTVILEKDGLITHKAIADAKQKGAFDALSQSAQ